MARSPSKARSSSHSSPKPPATPTRAPRKAATSARPGTKRQSPFLAMGKIWRLADMLSQTATRIYEPCFGLKNAELRILALLSSIPEVSINEIARQTYIDQAWISRSLKRLLEDGLVAKRPSPTDARMTLVSLTPVGEELFSQASVVMRDRERILLRKLPRKQVYEVLDALLEGAEGLYDYQPKQPRK